MHTLDVIIFIDIFDAATFMHILDAVIFMHILDDVIFMHILGAVIFIHLLDAVIFMHILADVIFMHILDAVIFIHLFDFLTFMHISNGAVFVHVQHAAISMHILYGVYTHIHMAVSLLRVRRQIRKNVPFCHTARGSAFPAMQSIHAKTNSRRGRKRASRKGTRIAKASWTREILSDTANMSAA